MNRKHTKQTKLKISLANKGKLAGKNNPMYGQVRPKYVCEAVSKSKKDTVWMHNDSLKANRQVKKDKVTEMMIDGWERGREKYE